MQRCDPRTADIARERGALSHILFLSLASSDPRWPGQDSFAEGPEVQGVQDWIVRVAVHQARVLGRDPWGRSPGQVLRKALCARGEGKRVRSVHIRRANAARERPSGLHREG